MLFGKSGDNRKDKAAETPRKKLMIGFDLRDDVCQMSYCMVDAGQEAADGLPEPVTFAAVPGRDIFDIPTVLAKKAGENTWFYGREAVKHSGDAAMLFLPHLLSQAVDDAPVAAENTEYDPAALLAMFINRCLSELTGFLPKESLKEGAAAVMFTARTMDGRMIEVLENVRKRLDLSCPVYYQSFAGSFYDFMLSQDPDLRETGSILFEYETGGKLRICKLFFNRRTTPVVSYQESREYPGLFAEDAGGRDAEFAKIIKEEAKGGAFSSAYLIGDGFKGGWMKKSAAELCRGGRRAFLGNNLYSKGAAYGAMYRELRPAFLQNYFFLDKNKLRSNVLVQAQVHGSMEEMTLLDAGQNWYEVHQTADLVLDGTGEINLILKPLTGGKAEPFLLRLDRLPVREGRITRIRIHFDMPSVDKLHLLIEDLGFGDIFPSSGLKWEQVITV